MQQSNQSLVIFMSGFFNTCDAIRDDFIGLPKLSAGVYLEKMELTHRDIVTHYIYFDCNKNTAIVDRLSGSVMEYFNTSPGDGFVRIEFASYYLTAEYCRIHSAKRCKSASISFYGEIRRIKCNSLVADDYLIRLLFAYGKKI